MTNYKTGLNGRLPTDGGNGLESIVDDMNKHPLRKRVAVVVFDAPLESSDAEKGVHTRKARLRRIEPVRNPDDLTALHAMLVRLSDERMGRNQLPITMAGDMEEAFDIEWNAGKYTLGDRSAESAPASAKDE